MPTLDLNDRTNQPLTTVYQRVWVWTKRNWEDDWEPRPDLTPTEITWAAAPIVDAAKLIYRYGYIILPGSAEETLYPALDQERQFILIRCDCDDGTTRDWLGRTDPPVTTEHFPARQQFPATGTQTIDAVGLLRSLQRTPILSTVHEIEPSGDFRRSPNVGATFNPDARKGNRTFATDTLTVGAAETEAAYAFADINSAIAEHWSTRDIVEHLLTFHLSTSDGNLIDYGASATPDDVIPWTIGDLDALPTWDKPRLETDGRTTAQLLDTLLRPSKLLGYRIRPVVTHPTLNSNETPFDDDVDLPVVDEVRVEFFTAAEADVTLPSIGTLPANDTLYAITANIDPLSTLTTTEDTTETVDQIQLRGPRELGVATFRTSNELDDDWTAAQATDYADGATGEAGYDTDSPSDQRRADDRIRSQKELIPVYSRLKFIDDWNGTADGDPVFVELPDDGDAATSETHIPYTGELHFAESLPFYESVDYQGPATAVDEADGVKTIKPIYTLEHPIDATRVRIEKLGTLPTGNDNSIPNLRPFGLSAEITQPLGLRLNVTSGPPHAIAGPAFSGTPADADQTIYGGFDYKTLQATLALVGNRRPAILIPASVDKPIVERKVVTLEHPSLQLVHVAAATVVDIDAAGDPVTSDGGLLRDPMPNLEALATIVAKHVLAPRRRLQIKTIRRFSELYPGDLITTVDTYGNDINAPVAQITLKIPIQTNPTSDAGSVETTITAASYTANIAELIG